MQHLGSLLATQTPACFLQQQFSTVVVVVVVVVVVEVVEDIALFLLR